MMLDDGEQIGRFKVRSLMRELELVSKQCTVDHRYGANAQRPKNQRLCSA
ncbi:hypothetical protein HX866_27665 [Pseudomonas gingeri]|nr:hypothetical protein [Pseudomonas gingeri]